jgi:sugar O-acyltransferase (sialic acid O-acetyltransferase NeuD family)
MKDIYILGDSGFAREIAFLIEQINITNKEWNIIGFSTNDLNKLGQNNGKYKIVITDDDLLQSDKTIYVSLGIGNIKINEKIIQKLEQNKNILFPNLIHPDVVGDWQRIKLGKGNIISSGCKLTTDIKIGDFNIINLSCTIGHECEIGNFNIINPSVNIAGGNRIKDRCYFGIGSQIHQFLNICSDCVIGASSLILSNINVPGTYLGVPAHKIM